MARRDRFRLLAPVPTEVGLHEAVAQALDRLLMPPAVWTTVAVGHIPLPPEWAAKLHRLGVKPSWPDTIVLHGGSCFGIELKTPSGKLTRTRSVTARSGARRVVIGQVEMFPLLEVAGMRIAVCRSVSDVLDALAAWGVPIRGRVAA